MTAMSSTGASQRARRRLLLALLLLSVPLLVLSLWSCAAGGAGSGAIAPGTPSPSAPLASARATAPAATASLPPATAHPGSPTPSATAEPANASGSGSGQGWVQLGGADFRISSAGVKGLLLGKSAAIPLTLTNPNSLPIYVTELIVTISADSTPAGCRSATNIQLVQSDASRADPILVPANDSVTLKLAPRAPRITLLNLPDVNQDACKNVVFSLTYRGSAHS